MGDEATPARREQSGQGHELSPWPLRLLVWAILIVLALAAIRVIDEHAMTRQTHLERPTPTAISQP